MATGYLIWRVSMKWRAAVERVVSPLGLTHAQYTVLASLSGLPRDGAGPSQRQLADFTGLEPVFISKLVRALEAAGFVERTAHPADTRAVSLRLTKRGNEVIGQAVRIVHELLEELTKPIGGTAGRRNQELITTLRALLGASPPQQGDEDMTQATTTLFGQDLGVAQRAGTRVLTTRVLEPEGLDLPEWIAMLYLNSEGAPVPREEFYARLEARGIEPGETEEMIGKLTEHGLLTESSGRLALNETGQARFDRLYATVRELAGELLGGMPAEDIETARRVLTHYARRAGELTQPYSR